MYERIYYAMISAALASSPDVPGEWERLLTQVIPYRLKLIERGECVDASVEAIRECVARLLASAPAQPTVPEGWHSVKDGNPPCEEGQSVEIELLAAPIKGRFWQFAGNSHSTSYSHPEFTHWRIAAAAPVAQQPGEK